MSSQLPRRDDVLEVLSSRLRAMTARELAARLRVGDASFPGFVRLLESLAQEGVLREIGEQRYALEGPIWKQSPRAAEREGVLYADPRGFGFVRSVGHDENLYIPDHAMAGALHGDTVIARPVRRSALGPEGEIVRVAKRAPHRIAGVLRRRGRSTWLEPDDARVRGPIVLRGEVKGEEGDAAVAVITRFPELPDENPEGELLLSLGEPGDPRVEVAKILLRENIEETHSAEVLREALAYGSEVAPEALEGREDLTHVPLPTIDPEDARDHDDAVWVERADDGTFTAYIAIADVSHYVRPTMALDDAARGRGCSIYLPDRAIPMLPPQLSANLCSLLPDKVRLCLCVVARLDAGANVIESRITRAFMKSRAKLTYPGVARALGFTQKPPRQKAAEDMLDGLKVADSLSQMLRTKRLRRGALDFALPEAKVVLDAETGAPVDVVRRGEDPGVRRAYQLIEELMLLANEIVGRFLADRSIGAIFRVHGAPDEERLERFSRICEQAGLPFEIEEAQDPKKLSAFLRKLSKHPKADVLQSLLLRAMKQATYDIANIGHFGLASPAYVHFTSPIRRYPDLVVHRIVKETLFEAERRAGGPRGEEREQKLIEAARLASERERKAMEIEREVVDLHRALLMRSHIGETFEGMVTNVVGAGAFIALDQPFVDVLVRADAMGKDVYELDEEELKFVARRSGDVVALGDRVVVTIEDVALQRRTVLAFRHTPDMSDNRPLRQHPFDAAESSKPRKKQSEGGPKSQRAGERSKPERPPERPRKKGARASLKPARKKKR